MDPLVGFQGILSLESFPTLSAGRRRLIRVDAPLAEQEGGVEADANCRENVSRLCVRGCKWPRKPLAETPPPVTTPAGLLSCVGELVPEHVFLASTL